MLKDILSAGAFSFEAGAHTELRGQLNRNRRVILLSGSIVANTRSDISGISARVWKNGVCGFSSMAEYSEDAAQQVLKAASENAVFMDSRVAPPKKALPVLERGVRPLEADIHDPEQKAYIEYAKALDAYVAEHCPNLISRRVVAMEDSMEKILVTSDGMSAHTILPRSYCYIIMTAQTPAGTPVELFKAVGGEGTFDVNFTDPMQYAPVADSLYEQLMQKREGVYADAGRKTVILGGMMTGMLSHEAVGHTVEADLVLGGSVAGHMLNKRVGSDLVTMTDFANTAFGKRCPLPVFVDDDITLTPSSESTAATSRSRFMRSSASTCTSTLYDTVADGAVSHSTSMMRSGSVIRSFAFGQSARCTDTPRPRVTKPMIWSPGTGLQHFERRTSTSLRPFTTMPDELCVSWRFGRRTLVSIGGILPVAMAEKPMAGCAASSVPRSTSNFSRRFATCCALSLPAPMLTIMSSASL